MIDKCYTQQSHGGETSAQAKLIEKEKSVHGEAADSQGSSECESE